MNDIEILSEIGLPAAVKIAEGMEGRVFTAGPGLVAKIWNDRELDDLKTLTRFYDILAAQQLSFATPRILEIHHVLGRSVSVERELSGVPLKNLISAEAPELNRIAVQAVVEVLTELRRVPGAGLPTISALSPDHTSPVRIDQLVAERGRRYSRIWQQRVPTFDNDLEVLIRRLQELDETGHVAPVHGDLCGENILVDSGGRVTAVLDWGFMSGQGDARFDAAIAAGVYDMYGPSAKRHAGELTQLLADEFGYSTTELYLLLGAYCVIASNAYSETGDGHFEWCVNNFQDVRVRDAIGL